MRKIKRLLFASTLMVLLLCFIKSGNSIEAKAEGVLTGSTTSINYEEEELMVNYEGQVYYTIIKKEDVTSVKANTLIEAARVGETNSYVIDISTVPVNKVSYIGLAATAVGGNDGMVQIDKVKIAAAPKKVAVKFNWAKEGAEAQGYGLLSSVDVTDTAGKTIVYKKGATVSATEKELNSENIGLQWRKGQYGNWADLSTLTNVKWKSMCASGATLYIRVKPSNTQGMRASKEIKMKISTPKAPSLKLDVSKLSLAIKNGMEYRKAGQSEWTTVLPFSAKSNTLTPTVKGVNVFDPNTMNTKLKISELTIAEIAAGSNLVAATEADITATALTLEFRMAASAKKPASIKGIIAIPYQMPAPTCVLSATAGPAVTYSVTTLSVNALDKTEKPGFEYLLIAEADIPKLDMAKAKWAALKGGVKLTDKAITKLTLNDDSKKEYKIGAEGVVMLVRRKGVAGSAKKAAVLASDYAKVVIPVAATPTPTVTPEPTATPTSTPTPTP